MARMLGRYLSPKARGCGPACDRPDTCPSGSRPRWRKRVEQREVAREAAMAGTGYHPEGHRPRPYEGTMQGVTLICINCFEVVARVEDFSDECVDDC